MSSLAGQSALITGGGSGIGLVGATHLARDGATVVLAGRNAEKLSAAAAGLTVAAAAVHTILRRHPRSTGAGCVRAGCGGRTLQHSPQPGAHRHLGRTDGQPRHRDRLSRPDAAGAARHRRRHAGTLRRPRASHRDTLVVRTRPWAAERDTSEDECEPASLEH